VNQLLPNAFTPKNIKSGFSVTEIWPFNADEDFSLSAMADRLIQDDKSLEHFRLSNSHTLNSTLDISSKPPTSDLNKGHSSSEGNLPHIKPAEIRLFQNQKHVERQESER
jgi:hypothetical protein